MKTFLLKYIVLATTVFVLAFFSLSSVEAANNNCYCKTDSMIAFEHGVGNYTTEQACSSACKNAGKGYILYHYINGKDKPIMKEGSAQCSCSSGEPVQLKYMADVYFEEILSTEADKGKKCNDICSGKDAKLFSLDNENWFVIDSGSYGSGGAPITSDIIPGETTDNSGIIKCGRPGQPMCKLCDLISGFNNIIQYLMKIAIGVALLAITIGGILYIISTGDSGLMEMAKSSIKNAAIGFALVLAAYLIVNTTIVYLGTEEDLGINASWGTFNCDVPAAPASSPASQ